MLLLGTSPRDNNGLQLTFRHFWCVTVVLMNTARDSCVVWHRQWWRFSGGPAALCQIYWPDQMHRRQTGDYWVIAARVINDEAFCLAKTGTQGQHVNISMLAPVLLWDHCVVLVHLWRDLTTACLSLCAPQSDSSNTTQFSSTKKTSESFSLNFVNLGWYCVSFKRKSSFF